MGAQAPDNEGSSYWKPVVHRLYSLYVEQRLCYIVQILAQLNVDNWRQILDFATGGYSFFFQALTGEVQPPALPTDVFVGLLVAFASGDAMPALGRETSVPFWYLEVMLLFRLLAQSPAGESGQPRFRAPSKTVQFLVRVLSSSAGAAFLLTLWTLQYQSRALVFDDTCTWRLNSEPVLRALDEAWARHGGDLLRVCQHILLDLYPDDRGDAAVQSAPAPCTLWGTPHVVSVITAVACHFSSHLLVAGAKPSPGGRDESRDQAHAAVEARAPTPFSELLHVVGVLDQRTADPASAARSVDPVSTADQFCICVRDVLRRLLGPAAVAAQQSPPDAARAELADGAGAVETPDIKTLGRIGRIIIQAFFANPALLAAREAALRDGSVGGHLPRAHNSDMISAGSCAGPSRPGDFVFITDQGPLRRSLAFMEQSALLQVVQNKLCNTSFDDFTGATEQLRMFALRKLRVLWFDLRRCTSTLKQGRTLPAGEVHGGAPAVLLVFKNLRLCLEHDWEARLATFPYPHLEGNSQVTVQSLAISVHVVLSPSEGVVFREVDVGPPDLEFQLHCTSTFYHVILSAVIKIFQVSLQGHIQRQVQQTMLQVLRQESSNWNASFWQRIIEVVPSSLISCDLEWLCSNIPPEGLPV